MLSVVSILFTSISAWFRSRLSVQLELIALRHQVAVYKQSISRPKLRPTDRLLWVWLSRLWPGWQEVLAFVQPRTVIAWQKKRCRNYWRRLSQSGKPGRPAIGKEVRKLIQDMWQSNPTWGSPRIVGELRKLGIDVAKSTVEKYRPKVPKPSSPTWKAFLNNHIQDLVACDFFIVPTVTCQVLFVFIMLVHERRRIVHFNVTEHPTAQWTAQQIIEAFPWESAPRYLLRDRDAIYGQHFQQRIKNIGIEEVKIAPRSPWQNPYCERVIGSIRRDVLDHVVVLHARHLMRLLTTYFSYYHRFRTHLSLAMDCPIPRAVAPPEYGPVRVVPEVGGLHHHYERIAA
jgi:transposase InsO family protein